MEMMASRMLALDGLDDGKHAILLLPHAQSVGAGMRGLAAKIEDVGTLGEQCRARSRASSGEESVRRRKTNPGSR